MKTFITLLKGLFLAGGLLLLIGFVIGASGYLRQGGAHSYRLIPYIAGIMVLALLGLILRRWVWPERKQVWKIIGAGFLLFMLFQFALALFASGSRGLAGMLDAVSMAMWLYVPWFWLPFALGILAGGFRRKARHAGPSEHPTMV